METLIQKQTRLNQQKYEQEQGKLGAFAGSVVSVNPIADEVGMSFGPATERTMPVQHPFVGASSWIRSMPEKGTLFLMQNRFDSGQPEAVKTIPSFSRVRVEEYSKGLNVYRPLQSGEHDIVSSGYAFAYFSRRGNLDLRSGASVKLQLNREQQDITGRAPTHRQEFLYNTAGMMGDEHRIGIVKRWKSAAEEMYVKKNGKFVTERYLQLVNPAKEGPAVLLRHIEGQVFDDKGQEIKHTTTAIPLRSQSLWYTTTDEYTKEEIDQNGNWIMEFPSTATTGLEILIPEGNYRKVIGKNRDVTINQDEKVVVQKNINYRVGSNVTYNITKDTNWKSGENTLQMLADAGSVHLWNKDSFGIEATPSALNITAPSGTSLKFSSSGAATLEAKGSMTLKVDQNATMEGQILNTNFQFVNLGKGASIPAAMGLALQTWLDQHKHPLNIPMGVADVPIVPSASFAGTPMSITSMKIMLAANT